jgi:hypothetical protein
MTSKHGNDVTIRFPASFILVFNNVSCLSCTLHKLYALFQGGSSISTARERIRSEVMSPFDSATTVSNKCLIKMSCMHPFKSYTHFVDHP